MNQAFENDAMGDGRCCGVEIASFLKVGRGVTAIVGAGGKTTLLYTLAEELRAGGRVLLATSTHIRRPERYAAVTEPSEDAIRDALSRYGAVCAGTPAEDGKLTAPGLAFSALAALADYVLVEADGAHCLPLKAHAPHEPVIPENAGRVILVAGMDGVGRPIRETCHRPAIYAALAGAEPDDAVTPEMAARVIAAEGFGDAVYLNKTDLPGAADAAERMAKGLSVPVTAGSLHRGEYICLR